MLSARWILLGLVAGLLLVRFQNVGILGGGVPKGTPQGAVTNPISASRRIDWTTNYALNHPPSTNYTACSTASCTGLTTSSNADAIITAINSASCNQYVLLPSGTITLPGAGSTATGLTINQTAMTCTTGQVILRGAGRASTVLKFTNAAGCLANGATICVTNGGSENSTARTNAVTVTSGYSQGSTSLVLPSTTGFAVNGVLVLDQNDDGNTDPGNTIWNNQVIQIGSLESGAAGCPAGSCTPPRSMMEFHVITACSPACPSGSSTTVTITPPVRSPNFVSGQSPGAWPIAAIHDVGIENLTIDGSGVNWVTADGGAGIGFNSCLEFANSYHVWMKNVREINCDRNAVWLYETMGPTVRDSYVYGTQTGGSTSYGIECYMCTDGLIENNMIQHTVAPVMPGDAIGTIIGYNYFVDTYSSGVNFQQQMYATHDAGTNVNLFEGNDGDGIMQDDYHGSGNLNTIFRNHFTGQEKFGGNTNVPPGKTQNTNAVMIAFNNRFTNLVGNVLGVNGYHTNYETFPASPTDAGTSTSISIFTFGWSDPATQTKCVNCDGAFTLNNDTFVRTSSMRWGNCDPHTLTWVCNFNSAEVPTGLTNYPNTPLPVNHNLQASMYLAAKPSYWGAQNYPAIGPDVTGGDSEVSLAWKIPARNSWEGGTYDPAYNQAVTTWSCTGGTCTVNLSANMPTLWVTGQMVHLAGTSPCTGTCVMEGNLYAITKVTNTQFTVSQTGTGNGTTGAVGTILQ